MPFVRIWVHFVFSTKNREPLLTAEVRKKLFQHLQNYAREKKIYLSRINGWQEHVHCLISLGSGQNVSDVARILKGSSSYWINKNQLVKSKFAWQKEYFAVSVSESQLAIVQCYIENQEKHHRKKTFDEEYQEFIEKYGFELR